VTLPPEGFGSDRDEIEAACADAQHPAWTTTGDSFHGVVEECACGARIYDTNGKELPR
jgi:hypothetical protein